MGVAVVLLNFRFVASEIEYVVNHSVASALVYDTHCKESLSNLKVPKKIDFRDQLPMSRGRPRHRKICREHLERYAPGSVI